MRGRDLVDLLALAAAWGSSFIFLRMTVPDFGPIAIVEVRVGIAALFLLVLLLARGKLSALIQHWKPIAMVGILNAVFPFAALAYASATLPAGLLSVTNAITPLWGAIIAWAWLKESLPLSRVLGLLVGFAGIVVLVSDKLLSSQVQGSGEALAFVAAVGGPFFYGLAACYTTRYLTGVDGMACATGSMVSAAVVLMPLALAVWPSTPVPMSSWMIGATLAIVSSGIAYLLFFRLIANVGPQKAITVTFLIPPFGVWWGWLLLDETPTLSMFIGAGIILVGTALATGVLGKRQAAAAAR